MSGADDRLVKISTEEEKRITGKKKVGSWLKTGRPKKSSGLKAEEQVW